MQKQLIDYGHFKVAVIGDQNVLITTETDWDAEEQYKLSFRFETSKGLDQVTSLAFFEEEDSYKAFENVTLKQVKEMLEYRKEAFRDLFGNKSEWDDEEEDLDDY